MLISILGIEKKDARRVIGGLFAYWFGRINLKRFIAYVDEDNPDEGIRIKDIARNNGYILKNCKLFAYAHYVAVETGTKKPKASDYGVTLRDAKYLRKLNLKHLKIKKYRSFTLKEFDTLITRVVEEDSAMKAHIGKLISKKMLFLIKSYNMKRGDLESELKKAALLGLYKQFPRYENRLHFVNIAKASIHNAAMSFITSSTTKGRNNLQRREDGTFESVHVDVAALSDVTAPDEYGSHFKEALTDLVRISPKLGDTAQRVVMILSGHFDEEFSESLGIDNTIAVDNMSYDKYQRKVRKFFDLSLEDIDRLYKYIRKQMAVTEDEPALSMA